MLFPVRTILQSWLLIINVTVSSVFMDSLGGCIQTKVQVFESKLMELLNMAGVKKSHTTPYHPMGNGITECFNRTLGNMIPPQFKVKWPQSLQILTFFYSCTIHETTGFVPFYLMFWRVPRLPIDVMFQHVLRDDAVKYSDFVSRLKGDIKIAKIAQKPSSLSKPDMQG